MRKQAGGLPAVLLLCSCLLTGCAGTRLCGSIYDYDGKPVENAGIEVRAEPVGPEPQGKSTLLKKDGSFVLDGLKPYTYYNIIAVCLGDSVKRDRADDIFVQEGKNVLPQDIRLRVVCSGDSTRVEEEPEEEKPGGTQDPKHENP